MSSFARPKNLPEREAKKENQDRERNEGAHELIHHLQHQLLKQAGGKQHHHGDHKTDGIDGATGCTEQELLPRLGLAHGFLQGLGLGISKGQ